jgi:predicted ATP-dependent Lon-type protease
MENMTTEQLFSHVKFVLTNSADFSRVLAHINGWQLPDFESQIHALENCGYQFDSLRDTYDQVSDPE